MIQRYAYIYFEMVTGRDKEIMHRNEHGDYVLYSDHSAELSRLASQSERQLKALQHCVKMLYMARESDDVMDDHNWNDYQNAIDEAKACLSSEAEQSDKPGETK